MREKVSEKGARYLNGIRLFRYLAPSVRYLAPSVAVLFLSLTGCAGTLRQAETYPMSFDQTYTTVLTALDEMKSWRVVETDQLNGLITIETGGFFQPRRDVKIMLKRLEPFNTEVELYQRKATFANQKFFNAIDARVNERALTYPR